MQDLAHIEPLARDLPQTRRGHERCVALLDSATELFLQRGFEAVSLDDIVNHAGGSKASIYKFFDYLIILFSFFYLSHFKLEYTELKRILQIISVMRH